MAAGFVVKSSTTATALVATTAKTCCNVVAGANRQAIICEISNSFDGITATAVPVLVEICGSTQAGAGTSTAFTPYLMRGIGAALCTGATDYTAEPTVLTPFKHWLVTPNGGLLVIQSPLGREAQSNLSGSATLLAIGLRDTAPAAVNSRTYIEFEE